MKLKEMMNKTGNEITLGDSLKLSAVISVGAIAVYALGYGVIIGMEYLKDRKHQKTVEMDNVNEVTMEELGLE